MLEIANLSHTYANGTKALDDVTLSIPRGMYGLLGPNGAGKSTLMRTVATLQAPTDGSIKFGDIDDANLELNGRGFVRRNEQRGRVTHIAYGVAPKFTSLGIFIQLAVRAFYAGVGRLDAAAYLRVAGRLIAAPKCILRGAEFAL